MASLVRTDADWQVEVRSPREDARSFLAAVGVAIAAWSGGERDAPIRRDQRSTA